MGTSPLSPSSLWSYSTKNTIYIYSVVVVVHIVLQWSIYKCCNCTWRVDLYPCSGSSQFVRSCRSHVFLTARESLVAGETWKDQHIWGCTILCCQLFCVHRSMAPFAILAWLASVMWLYGKIRHRPCCVHRWEGILSCKWADLTSIQTHILDPLLGLWLIYVE